MGFVLLAIFAAATLGLLWLLKLRGPRMTLAAGPTAVLAQTPPIAVERLRGGKRSPIIDNAVGAPPASAMPTARRAVTNPA